MLFIEALLIAAKITQRVSAYTLKVAYKNLKKQLRKLYLESVEYSTEISSL